MMAKTEWYEEILALDPSSKVFWPFARHLAAEGQMEKAMAVLQQGLMADPSHTEARMMLVHLLNEQGKTAEADQQAEPLAAALIQYPGVWDALARLKKSKSRDVRIALQVVGKLLRCESCSLLDIVAAGLDGAGDKVAPLAEDSASESCSTVQQIKDESFHDDALSESSQMKSFMQNNQQNVEPVFASGSCVTTDDTATGADQDGKSISQDTGTETSWPDSYETPHVLQNLPETDTDEPVTLRTRSMAEVLAEQGDIAGALAIYDELSALAPDDEALMKRIAELRSRNAPDTEDELRDELAMSTYDMGLTPESLNDGQDHDMKWMLENLADRLDARAHL